MSRFVWLSLFACSVSHADVWVAECKGLEFRFDRTAGMATVFLVTQAGRFQLSKGKIGFDNGVAVRAPFEISPDGERGPTDIGLNTSRGIVYAMQRLVANQVRDAVFCETEIQKREDEPEPKKPTAKKSDKKKD